MRKILILALSLYLFIISNTYAFDYTQLSNKNMTCSSTSEKIVYLSSEIESKFSYNNFSTSDDRFISNTSKIYTWSSDENLLS
ncbi:hypothetical protein HOG21_06910 [bacterium]|jgi:hypothetical protein|nr:hypothetical protein [bacterium]